MDRRELLKMVALLTGGTVVGGNLFLAGCKSADKTAVAEFSAENIALLDEIGETIIPATNTPGAKAAKIGEFMKVMVSDCYTQAEQDRFMSGLDAVNDAAEKAYNKTFIECNAQERTAVFTTLEKEAGAFNKKRDEDERPKREAQEKLNSTITWKDQKPYVGEPSHYYTMMKQLTLIGFFTSKTGMTETLRHVPVPGRYDGNVAYAKGEKAWAE